MPDTTYVLQKSPFRDFRPYVRTLKILAGTCADEETWSTRCFAALNGEANRELRRVVPIEIRREYGAFFTGTNLSAQLLARANQINRKSVFFDPTCGMGDLLLAAAKRLPLGTTPSQTLRKWGQQIGGTDLHPEFVEGAKARLMLLAIQLHGASGIRMDASIDYFPNIRVGEGLDRRKEIAHATHVLLNPPFGAIQAPSGCKWASGGVTAAAVFVLSALEQTLPGTEILAVLPEVLRSGSHSAKWRDVVSDYAAVHLVETCGVFDQSADVDVFILRLVRRDAISKPTKYRWPELSPKKTTTISDFFEVHVGRVVPHRDKKSGPRLSYIHARCVPTWTVMTHFAEMRKHKGQAFIPPFVVIRRTSRPEQPYRAIATVISGSVPVAVENHLIVCQPKDGKLSTCKKLMTHLKTPVVNIYLNSRIRCRHLTVGAIRDVPFIRVAP